ncbi:hypothetical protein TWF788_003171 [Orbilia oligospora]|uniref:Uncharacterized protein n=1 Tax=Orbilia oligospora TaxID=2813651 RepID=A0A7C8P950_ORBOL|nr:hypothetical protein TWF788_003171 [Orbilia oligospora]
MAKPPKIVVESPIDHTALAQALSDDDDDLSFFTSLASATSTPLTPIAKRRSLEAPIILDTTRLMAANIRPLNFSRRRQTEHRRQSPTPTDSASQAEHRDNFLNP